MQLFYLVCLAIAPLCQHRGLTFVSPSGDVLIETWAPARELIDDSSISSCGLEQLPTRFGALAIEKQDLLLICNVFVLFRADICDQQTSGTWIFLLWFLLIPLKCTQDLFSAHTIILTCMFSSSGPHWPQLLSKSSKRQEFIGELKFGP